MSGWSRNSHIRLATATDVATVDEKIGAERADAAQLLVGERGETDAERQPERHGDQRELGRRRAARAGTRRCATRRQYWSHPFDWQLSPWTSQRWWPSHDGLAERVEHERRRGSTSDGASSASASRQVPPPLAPHGGRGHVHPNSSVSARAAGDDASRVPADDADGWRRGSR